MDAQIVGAIAPVLVLEPEAECAVILRQKLQVTSLKHVPEFLLQSSAILCGIRRHASLLLVIMASLNPSDSQQKERVRPFAGPKTAASRLPRAGSCAILE
jgi:hypothetical protein